MEGCRVRSLRKHLSKGIKAAVRAFWSKSGTAVRVAIDADH
jgi:hypothetical protein